MKPYSCPECSYEFNEPTEEVDTTTSLVHCPRCNALLEGSPVQEADDGSKGFLQSILPPPLPRGVLGNPDWEEQKPELNETELSELEQLAENSSLTDDKNANRLTPDDYEYWKPSRELDDISITNQPNLLAIREVASYPPQLVIDDPNLDQAEQFVRKTKLQITKLMWLLFSCNGRIGRAPYFWSIFIQLGIAVLGYLIITSIYNTNLITIFHHNSSSTSKEALETLIIIGLIPFLWSNWAITLKRYHDFNSSWGTMLIVALISELIPFFGLVGFAKGTQGPNRYGASPGWINRPPTK
jgi:uncharacterized membrane protein YhaH (DUF805 family)